MDHIQDTAVASRQTKAGWKAKTWAVETDMCRASVYKLMNAGRLETVKIGKMRRIVTSPAEFMASLPRV
jgi:hypothetical protein